jgi:hypothetical protein
MHAWDMVLDKLQGKWNFMGVVRKPKPPHHSQRQPGRWSLCDLFFQWRFCLVCGCLQDIKNEPHGTASWGGSNPSYDW